MRKASDGYALAKFRPTIDFYKMRNYICEFDSVKRIVGLRFQKGI